MIRIRHDDLTVFTRQVLDKVGLDEFSAGAVTLGLCQTSLRGVDSHGIRLLPHYVNSARNGRKNPRPNFQLTRNFPAVGRLDADNAFGHAAGMHAMDLCCDMAAEFGIGAVGVVNSSHPGAMATFALHAAERGFIAFAFTHADSLLLSANGTRPYFGTNPVCMAAPRQGGTPYCLDMATSAIPWNRLLLHKAKGEPLPEPYGADAEGNPTTDPLSATCLMPFGGYKGYALSSMVEVLCGVFTGMAFGREIPAMYKSPIEEPRRLGQFFMAIHPGGCIDGADFAARMAQMAEEVHAEPAKPGLDVMLPGDKEDREAERRRAAGIPLDPETVLALKALGAEYGIALSLIEDGAA